MTKKSESEELQFPEATIIERPQKSKFITDPQEVEAGILGNLHSNGKRIVCVKGFNTAEAAFQIYRLFSEKVDDDGEAFRLSIKRHGLVHNDPIWHCPAKVSGLNMADYLSRWMLPCQLLESAAAGRALLVLDKFPNHFIGVIMQPRFLSIAAVADLFATID